MEDQEQLNKQALELLKSIKTLDDMKEHKEEILDLIEEYVKYGVEMLKKMLDFTKSKEETEQDIAKMQEQQQAFFDEVDREMTRISGLPGADEFMESLSDDMEKRIVPHLEESSKQMAELMGSMMGDLMEGFGEMLGSTMDNKENIIELEDDEKETGDKKEKDEDEE